VATGGSAHEAITYLETCKSLVAIAFCALVEPEGVFVPADKRAAFLALAELGPGRVATPFDLWAHLKDGGLITTEQFTFLCERTAKGGGLPGVPLRFGHATQR
jgi:hypothetical protein